MDTRADTKHQPTQTQVHMTGGAGADEPGPVSGATACPRPAPGRRRPHPPRAWRHRPGQRCPQARPSRPGRSLATRSRGGGPGAPLSSGHHKCEKKPAAPPPTATLTDSHTRTHTHTHIYIYIYLLCRPPVHWPAPGRPKQGQ